MPKIVDVEGTRLLIAKAACKAISRRGISAVTMIDIAKAANVTTGMITHYFGGKAEIIAAAISFSFLNIERNLARLMEKGETDLATLLDIAIPTSKARFEDSIVWVSFWGGIATDPEFRRLNAILHRQPRDIYARLIRVSWPESREWPAEVFEAALQSIVTFIFGLTAGGVTNRAIWTAAVQRSQLQSHLRLVRQASQIEAQRLAATA